VTIRLASVAVILMALAAWATASGNDALAALRAQFGTAIEFKAAPRPEIRYCPDNTCEMFRAAQRASGGDLADFALLYLWGVSQYAYLESWQRTQAPAAVRGALQRRGRECSSTSEPLRLACTLRALARGAGIQPFFLRYDEGVVAEENADLEEQLGRLK